MFQEGDEFNKNACTHTNKPSSICRRANITLVTRWSDILGSYINQVSKNMYCLKFVCNAEIYGKLGAAGDLERPSF